MASWLRKGWWTVLLIGTMGGAMAAAAEDGRAGGGAQRSGDAQAGNAVQAQVAHPVAPPADTSSVTRVYKWQDAHGLMHYSDEPPPRDAVAEEQLSIAPAAAPTVDPDTWYYSIPKQLQRMEESRRAQEAEDRARARGRGAESSAPPAIGPPEVVTTAYPVFYPFRPFHPVGRCGGGRLDGCDRRGRPDRDRLQRRTRSPHRVELLADGPGNNYVRPHRAPHRVERLAGGDPYADR